MNSRPFVLRSPDEPLEVVIDGSPLSIATLSNAASHRGRVLVAVDDALESRMERSVAMVDQAVDEGQRIYGVTTGFGGMADVTIPREHASASQNNLLKFLATGAGKPIDRVHVRGAMLLRANVLARGCSGVRAQWVHRLIRFIESDYTPVVRELGSIGASGDLVPLSAIARAITGQSDFVEVEAAGEFVPGPVALRRLGFKPLELLPKEGLALINGTSFSASVAANCVHQSKKLMSLTMALQAIMLQSLVSRAEPFESFVHQQKPHPGQQWAAKMMRELLSDDQADDGSEQDLVQDRYSVRCLPQYMAPIVEGIARVEQSVTTEMNSVSDNPLVDPDSDRFYQSGNFLGQYIGMAMDDLRRFIGLMSKHLDVQIASLMSPEFSNGLPASLRGNEGLSYNMGLKGIQVLGNSIMPMLTYHGNPLVEHYPTHAEQFNQNVNGLSWGAAHLAWDSVKLFQHYLSAALIVAVQAIDLRAAKSVGHYDGRRLLNPITTQIYEATCEVLDCPPSKRRPFLFDDQDRWLEAGLAAIESDLSGDGGILQATVPILQSFEESFA